MNKLAFTTCTDKGFILGAMGTISSIRKFYTAEEADIVVFIDAAYENFEAFCKEQQAEIQYFGDIAKWIGPAVYDRQEYARNTDHFYHPNFKPVAGVPCTDTVPSLVAPFGSIHHMHPLNVKAYCTGFCLNVRQYERVVHIDADAFLLSRIESAFDGFDGDAVISSDDGADGLKQADALLHFTRPENYRDDQYSFNAGIVYYANGPVVQQLMRDFMFFIDSCYHYTNFGNDQGLLRALVLKYTTISGLRFRMLDGVNWNPTWNRADKLIFSEHNGCWVNERNSSKQFAWHGAGQEKLWTRRYTSEGVNAAWRWIGGQYADEMIDRVLTVSAARFGVDGRWIDCTGFIRSKISEGSLTVVNDGEEAKVLGDPAPGATKFFEITYTLDGVEKTESFPKNVKVWICRKRYTKPFAWTDVDGSLRGHILVMVANRVLTHFENKDEIRILDMGTQHGRTAVGFCELLRMHGKKPKLTTLDIYGPSSDYPLSFAREQMTRETIAASSVADCITALKVDPLEDYRSRLPDQQFDFIYVDADHTFKHVLADCRLALNMLAPGGIIIGDDYQLESVRAGVALALGEVVNLGENQWCLIPRG